MIHVTPAAKPPDFDKTVREPGLSAISELIGKGPLIKRRGPKRKQFVIKKKKVTKPEDIPPDAFPTYWTNALPELLESYDRICGYVCVYIERVTGAASVDHMIAKSLAWDRVYEWDNYRLACSLMNSHKNDARDVLDPFEVEDGWFQLELVGYQLVPAPGLDAGLVDRIKETINRLKLNRKDCRDLREEYAADYESGEISFSYLGRRAPLVAAELKRQGQLRAEDR